MLAAIERDLRQRYRENYRIVASQSSTEALEAARELKRRGTPIALFVVDQRMPGASPHGAFLRQARRPHRLSMNTGGPYNEIWGSTRSTTAAAGRDGRGVARNSLETTGYASLDIRASRDIKLGGGKDGSAIALGFDAFNVLNRVNYGSFVGTLSSPLYGQPVSARPARQLQFSARVKF